MHLAHHSLLLSLTGEMCLLNTTEIIFKAYLNVILLFILFLKLTNDVWLLRFSSVPYVNIRVLRCTSEKIIIIILSIAFAPKLLFWIVVLNFGMCAVFTSDPCFVTFRHEVPIKRAGTGRVHSRFPSLIVLILVALILTPLTIQRMSKLSDYLCALFSRFKLKWHANALNRQCF